MRTALLVCFAVTLSAVAAPVPKSLKKPSDAELMEGRWVSVTLDAGGGKGVADDDTYRIEFKDGKVRTCSTKYRWAETWSGVTLDTTARPKTLDITRGDGSVCKGIYKFEGDSLVWCHSTNVGRPEKFESAGEGWCCFVLRRAKDKE